jgi:protocatechuate 3,4-dioxygenase beta subunit
MKTLFKIGYVLLLVSLSIGCNAQTKDTNNQSDRNNNKVIGGPFENAESIYIGMPDNINSIDTSAGWTQK